MGKLRASCDCASKYNCRAGGLTAEDKERGGEGGWASASEIEFGSGDNDARLSAQSSKDSGHNYTTLQNMS